MSSCNRGRRKTTECPLSQEASGICSTRQGRQCRLPPRFSRVSLRHCDCIWKHCNRSHNPTNTAPQADCITALGAVAHEERPCRQAEQLFGRFSSVALLVPRIALNIGDINAAVARAFFDYLYSNEMPRLMLVRWSYRGSAHMTTHAVDVSSRTERRILASIPRVPSSRRACRWLTLGNTDKREETDCACNFECLPDKALKCK